MSWIGQNISSNRAKWHLPIILCKPFFAHCSSMAMALGILEGYHLQSYISVVAEIWLVQIVFSVIWLRYYKYGPVEWLWRRLVNRKYFSNKKQ